MGVYFLLDRSGSMSSLWDEALGGINAYVEGLPKETDVILAVFDTNSYDVIRNTKAGLWKNITNEDASPRGGTPLLDSAGRMLWRMFDDNHERSIFVVMTDGFENSSKHFNKNDIKKLIAQAEFKKWEVIFLGANFDKIGDVASDFVNSDKFLSVGTRNLGNYIGKEFNIASSSYLTTGQSISIDAQTKERVSK